MSNTVSKIVKEKISRAKNLGEVFRILEQHYDLDRTELGFVSRTVILQKIDYLINYMNPPVKKDLIRSH